MELLDNVYKLIRGTIGFKDLPQGCAVWTKAFDAVDRLPRRTSSEMNISLFRTILAGTLPAMASSDIPRSPT